MKNYAEEQRKKEKFYKAIDKMQGIKTYCVTEIRTTETLYTVKATDADTAMSIVQDRRQGWDEEVDYGSDEVQHLIDEVT